MEELIDLYEFIDKLEGGITKYISYILYLQKADEEEFKKEMTKKEWINSFKNFLETDF